VTPYLGFGDAPDAFVISKLQASAYYAIDEAARTVLAGRVAFGSIMGGTLGAIPASRRFYAGGGGSVRGYEYNSIFPEDRRRLALTPGGQGLLEGSIEARWRSRGPYGAAVFLDGGNAFDSWGEATDLRYGAGVGFRYDLGFAPLRVDLAIPLDREEEEPSYALYISLGQAF
jgi:translocation and assembly module TamA